MYQIARRGMYKPLATLSGTFLTKQSSFLLRMKAAVENNGLTCVKK
jgi:hypothetical protein